MKMELLRISPKSGLPLVTLSFLNATFSLSRLRLRLYGWTLAALVFVTLSWATASAQEPQISSQALQQIEALLEAKTLRTPAELKVDSQLLAVARMSRGEPVARGIQWMLSRIDVGEADTVLVDVKTDASEEVLSEIEFGVRVESRFQLESGSGITSCSPCAIRSTKSCSMLPGIRR